MTLHERADKLLALREDLYEMHFHEVDRKWLIDAMVDFAQQLPQQEISDEEIYNEAKNHHNYYEWSAGAKWYREQLKQL
jgi:hypothetical protein